MTPPNPAGKPAKAAALLSIDGVFATLARTRDEQRALLGRHRRTVSIAKFVLPALAAVLLVALAVFPNLRSGANFGRISYKKQTTAHKTPLSRMSVARYRGVDAQGQKFTVTAKHALQISENRLSLTRPKGDIMLNSGAWLMLNARTGLYHQKTQMLGLAGKVTLYRADGTTLRTHRAAIDLKNDSAAGSDPVFAYGPFGKLRSKDGFAVRDRGSKILFKGISHLTLDQVSAPPSGTGGTQ
ncbi:LPS export ABC transporter periplasmic protein LptC [Acidiphilium sp. AL]|uniref:LPS export ABC transporter periplasmic protein LptC n=1 Tax=Acidiphilium iwatense TaxID=768198 RepID=A0ABS9DSR9_9PROT|nr:MULTISPECIES: LPS export ABC transporter periplasmic protein LptC [Acidiphilium]MCF3945727.1 LPS export ABC transporter periplasmic protein LptC [Acidiphilium iwatense]MCU4159308.1 LPS export ABC transporter periplasmic protein LptC [Acidiphilium sp. AL]